MEIAAEPLFEIGPFTFTNSMVGALLTTAILLTVAFWFSRRSALVPNRRQSLIELPIEWMANIVQGAGGTRWRSFVPFILTIFLTVLVANWIGLLPGVGTIGLAGEHDTIVPFLRPASADLNFTLALALITFVVFVSFGIRANGLRGWLKEFLGEPRYMSPLMAPIHIISELSRLISLSMRLFGNVFAGEVLLATMLAITTAAIFILPLAFFVPGIFLGLEMIFGFVQALVFALLAMTYISMAIAEHAAHDDNHAEAPVADAVTVHPAPTQGAV
ncbi:MAG: F0F1 ATP synthase subunit A [Chloroflexota bacterium]|nr:F0F1 ATP synthase subunit A [Chloroflexota bacterium]